MISNRDCELDYKSLQNFSPSIQDLMYKISAKKPRNRLTAKESLNHKLFKELGLVQEETDIQQSTSTNRHKKKEQLEELYTSAKEEKKKYKRMDIPSLDLDKLKHYNTTKTNQTQNIINKKEVLSDRESVKPIYVKDKFPNHIYANHQRSIKEMSSNEAHQNKKFGWSMTGRGIFNDHGMYDSNQKSSAKRQYQSTDRTGLLKDNDPNLQLYAHKKNVSYVEGNNNNGNLLQNERRGWAKDQHLKRFGSIGVNDKKELENSLTPGQHTRGLSILNKDKNNFVRDVSERVKREPILQYNEIKLYQQEPINQEYNMVSDDSQNITKMKSVELIKSPKSFDIKENISIVKQDTLEEQMTPKTGTLKHLKRRTAKQKKNDTSIKKSEKNKKKTHHSNFSSKFEKPYENKKPKQNSIEKIENKNKKNKKISSSQNKQKKTKKTDKIKKTNGKDQIALSSLYSDNNQNKSKKKTKKGTRTNSTVGKDKPSKKIKNLNLKNKISQQNLSESNERKRYMSVNASGKNPLLESEFELGFNPRKTLNPIKSNQLSKNTSSPLDVEKTNLFSYKSGDIKKANLYGSNTERPSLYQRPMSQASSESEENKQGKYKNLYSGRHEKNILQFNPDQNKLKESEQFEIGSSDEGDALNNIGKLMDITQNKSDENDKNGASKNIDFTYSDSKPHLKSSIRKNKNSHKLNPINEITKLNASVFKEGSFSKLGRLTSSEIPLTSRSPISSNHFEIDTHFKGLKKNGYNNNQKRDPLEIMKERSKKEQLRIQEIEEWKRKHRHLKNKLSSGKIPPNLFKHIDPKSLTSSYSGKESLVNYYQKTKFKHKPSDGINTGQMNLKNFSSNTQMYNYGINNHNNLNFSKNKFSMKQKSFLLSNKQDLQSNKSKEHVMPEISKQSNHNKKQIL
jgi:hypothetical protein